MAAACVDQAASTNKESDSIAEQEGTGETSAAAIGVFIDQGSEEAGATIEGRRVAGIEVNGHLSASARRSGGQGGSIGTCTLNESLVSEETALHGR